MAGLFNNSSTSLSDVRRRMKGGPAIVPRADTRREPQPAQQAQPRTGKGRLGRSIAAAAFIIACLAGLLLSAGKLVLAYGRPAGVDAGYAAQIPHLSNAEQAEWEAWEQDAAKAYIQINSEIEVQAGEGSIRLINPPYSGHAFDMRLVAEGAVIFEQKNMLPGQMIEKARFAELKPGEYNAVAEYDFYDGLGRLKRSSSVDIVLVYV